MDTFPPDKKCCHLTGFKKYCRKLVMSGACQGRWVGVAGTNPQTGEQLDHYACIDDHAVVLQLDQTRRVSGMQSAIESLRNETVKILSQNMLQQAQQHRETLALTVETQMRMPELLPGYVDKLAIELKSEG